MSISAVSSATAIAPRARERRLPDAAPALPDMPKPVTPATAAVHLMQVPSSRVIETLASLQHELGRQARVGRASDDAAQRLARAVAPAVSGARVNVQA